MGLLVKFANKIEENGKKLAEGASELVNKGVEIELKKNKMTKLEKTISKAKALEMALEWNKERIEKGEQPFVPNSFSWSEKKLLLAEIKKLQDERAIKELEAFSSEMKS